MTRFDFTLVAYNVFLRPRYLLFMDGQWIRSHRLARYLDEPSYDAIAISEVFDEPCRAVFTKRLKRAFPYQTPVVGQSQATRLIHTGGVMVASRWPIEHHQEMLFGAALAGGDRLARKGVIYARIRKQDRPVHVFATHTNASSGHHKARAKQLTIVRQLIRSCQIPETEPVLIAGDLNVNRADQEYQSMLDLLEAKQPDVQGHPYTYDPKTNGLAAGWEQMFLDYVLYSRRHLQPQVSENEVIKLQCTRWRQRWWLREHRELSDHYPVIGRFTFDD